MSKHIFEQTIDGQTIDGQTYEVQIGWDKPCQHFYGVISPWVEDAQAEEGGYFDDPVWSNLFFDKAFSLEEIAVECEQRGLIVPDGLLDNVREDAARNAINEVTLYRDTDPPRVSISPPQPD